MSEKHDDTSGFICKAHGLDWEACLLAGPHIQGMKDLQKMDDFVGKAEPKWVRAFDTLKAIRERRR